jgi:hypothetical protein
VVIRTSSQLAGGDIVMTRLAEGSFTSKVETSSSESAPPDQIRTAKRKSKT